MSVPKTARLMLDSGIPSDDVHQMCYANALEAYAQSGQIQEAHWQSAHYDQSELYEGNSVLRGQTPLVKCN